MDTKTEFRAHLYNKSLFLLYILEDQCTLGIGKFDAISNVFSMPYALNERPRISPLVSCAQHLNCIARAYIHNGERPSRSA